MLTYGTVACYYKTVERATKSKQYQHDFRQTFFEKCEKVLYKMVLVSDVLEHAQ